MNLRSFEVFVTSWLALGQDRNRIAALDPEQRNRKYSEGDNQPLEMLGFGGRLAGHLYFQACCGCFLPKFLEPDATAGEAELALYVSGCEKSIKTCRQAYRVQPLGCVCANTQA